MNRVCNLKRCPHDHRDYIYQPPRPLKSSVKKVDLTYKMPDVLDQGEYPTCSCNAVSNLIKYISMLEKKNAIQPSRLYLYYTSRVFIRKQNCSDNETGICIRDVCKAAVKYLICDERIFPYSNQISQPPSIDVFKSCFLYKKILYAAVPHNLVILKTTLYNEQPIIAGISIYPTFISGQVENTGIIPMPDISTEEPIGLHTVLLVGFDDDTRMFKAMLSWGKTYGDDGYIYLSYDYIMNPFFSFDFWVIYYF